METRGYGVSPRRTALKGDPFREVRISCRNDLSASRGSQSSRGQKGPRCPAVMTSRTFDRERTLQRCHWRVPLPPPDKEGEGAALEAIVGPGRASCRGGHWDADWYKSKGALQATGWVGSGVSGPITA